LEKLREAQPQRSPCVAAGREQGIEHGRLKQFSLANVVEESRLRGFEKIENLVADRDANSLGLPSLEDPERQVLDRKVAIGGSPNPRL
jgi:hypothetical protein